MMRRFPGRATLGKVETILMTRTYPPLTAKRGNIWACGIAGLIVGALLLAGCGDSEGFKAPASFTASDESVSKAVTEAINGGTSPGLAKPPTVNCSAGECSISYVVKEPTGISFDDELMQPTRQVWKALFEDPSIKAAKITVEGPVTSVGGQKSTGTIYWLECTREDASQINWDEVEADGMKKLCNYHKEVE
jgi:hypothetical protein